MPFYKQSTYNCREEYNKSHNYQEDYVNIAEYKVMQLPSPPSPAESLICAMRTEHKVES